MRTNRKFLLIDATKRKDYTINAVISQSYNAKGGDEMEVALELLLKALEMSGKALYWVTIGPIIELIKLIFGIA